ncbi:hypothetical protein [Oricola sp.]|uniref:hypothetical protein n=1 Tax=Oricola sp. TaxID=1979950 RepID=UPI0025EF5C99|nr:hypothetical protein [Oricola sp.]MCI5077204.1 hypothetical protein [Oricola sp.]
MRFLGLLLLLAGLAGAFGERLLGQPIGKFEIGRYPLQVSASGDPLSVTMRADDVPVELSLWFDVPLDYYNSGEERVFTLTVREGGDTVISKPVYLSPKTAYLLDEGGMLVEDAARFDTLASGQYTFQLSEDGSGQGPEGDVELILTGNADMPALDLPPIGFTLIAVGGVIVALSGRRRSRRPSRADAERDPEKPRSRTSSIGYRQPEPEPEPEKSEPDITWGRDGDKS